MICSNFFFADAQNRLRISQKAGVRILQEKYVTYLKALPLAFTFSSVLCRKAGGFPRAF
jgi:hypothetical protein